MGVVVVLFNLDHTASIMARLFFSFGGSTWHLVKSILSRKWQGAASSQETTRSLHPIGDNWST